MNIWHDIKEERIKKDDFISVIEITKGGKNKYELEKETGMLRLDRVLYTATHYPANYGFIPRTYAEDDDPLVVFVLCSQPIEKMSLVRCYPIGIIYMTDRDETDEKVIAIVGCGRIAKGSHFPAFDKMDNIRIKYACDLIEEKALNMQEKYPKIENVITDYKEALADPEVEAVYVLTPNYAHYTVTMDSLQAGKHVFCE